MMIRRFICSLLVFLFAQPSIRAESYWQLALEDHSADSTKAASEIQPSLRTKKFEDERFRGYFIAVVPGFFIHGAGNMYAGRPQKGLLMLSLELISLVGIIVSEEQANMENRAQRDNKYIAIEAASLLLFFGSWIWDIATVEDTIKARHQKGKVDISISGLQSPFAGGHNTNLMIVMTIRF